MDYYWQDGLLTQQMLHYYLEVTIQGVTTREEILISSKFVYDESNQPVGCVANGEAAYAFVRNLQGDIIAVVDQDGETLVEYSYDPWGKVTSTHNGENLTELEASLVMVMCPFAYRGYNYDYTTGLYYLQSRYYNPEWGRFLNCDDTNILLATQGETLGANLFAYCNNNPVNRVDYEGKSAEDLINVVVPSIVIIMFLSSYYNNQYFEVRQYGGAGAIKIKLNTKPDAKIEEGCFAYAIYQCLRINEDITYSILALMTNSMFRQRIGSCFALRDKQRSILFSDECLKEEIQLHTDAYLASAGKEDRKIPVRFSLYSFRVHPISRKNRLAFIRTACYEIDIKEYDVTSPVENFGFLYYNGIRPCYLRTKADPYYSEILKARIKFLPSEGNTDWSEHLFENTD